MSNPSLDNMPEAMVPFPSSTMTAPTFTVDYGVLEGRETSLSNDDTDDLESDSSDSESDLEKELVVTKVEIKRQCKMVDDLDLNVKVGAHIYGKRNSSICPDVPDQHPATDLYAQLIAKRNISMDLDIKYEVDMIPKVYGQTNYNPIWFKFKHSTLGSCRTKAFHSSNVVLSKFKLHRHGDTYDEYRVLVGLPKPLFRLFSRIGKMVGFDIDGSYKSKCGQFVWHEARIFESDTIFALKNKPSARTKAYEAEEAVDLLRSMPKDRCGLSCKPIGLASFVISFGNLQKAEPQLFPKTQTKAHLTLMFLGYTQLGFTTCAPPSRR